MDALSHRGIRLAAPASALGLALVLGLAACGSSFDPASELSSVRVLAVKKDLPYAAPGSTVNLSILDVDASDDPAPELNRAWLSGCFNPPGDLFTGCIESFSRIASELEEGQIPPGLGFGTGNTFSFDMPEDIISSRPPPLDREQPPYGLAVVFFATCTGELGFDANAGSGFPIVCTDEDGEPLGSSDYVAGYSLVYAYAAIENKNPEILGFRFGGREVTPDCIGDGCLSAGFAEPDCDESPELCVDGCPADGAGDCEIPIAPELERSIVEIDEVTERLSGEAFGEQMWINYYVDRGSVKSAARLLNDGASGWNEDFGTAFFAPRESGPVHIWAVVHDNRGGVEWVRQTVYVR